MLHAAWGGWLPSGVQSRSPAVPSPSLSPSQHPWASSSPLEAAGDGTSHPKGTMEESRNAGSCLRHSWLTPWGARHLLGTLCLAQEGGRMGLVGAAEASPMVQVAVVRRYLQPARPGGSGSTRAQSPGMSPALCRQSGAVPLSDAASAASVHAARQRSWASDAWTCVKFT